MRALISACGEGFRKVAARGAAWGGVEAGSGINKDGDSRLGGGEEVGSGMNKDGDSRLGGGDCWVLVMFVKNGSITGSCSRGWEDFRS